MAAGVLFFAAVLPVVLFLLVFLRDVFLLDVFAVVLALRDTVFFAAVGFFLPVAFEALRADLFARAGFLVVFRAGLMLWLPAR